jgi:hypothetical protein
MSPRKNNVLTVEGWSNPKKGKLYKGIVKKADKKAKCVHVTIENLDPTQLGRMQEIKTGPYGSHWQILAWNTLK